MAASIRAAQADISAARLVVLEKDDPAGPHQVRVAIRRLRAALRAFRLLADMPSTRKLDSHAKAIADAVASLREADVLLHETCSIKDVDGDAGHGPLRLALEAHRATQLRAARRALTGKRWSSLMFYLSLAGSTAAGHPALTRPLSAFAGEAIERRWRKVAAAGTGFAHQSAAERHTFRLQLKKLRYTIDVFKPLFARRRAASEEVASFQARLKALQDMFGYFNDVAQAGRLTGIVARGASGDGAALRLAGYIQGWHAARAEHEWRAARRRWKRLRSAPRFWR